MGKALTGLFVGVFVGAVVYELLTKTEMTQRTARRVCEGLRSAKQAFGEGFRSVARPSPASG